MSHEEVLSIAVIVMGALSALLWLIPSPCKCEKCGFHVNERRMAAEADRAQRHREYHVISHKAWGDTCKACKAGNEGDKPS